MVGFLGRLLIGARWCQGCVVGLEFAGSIPVGLICYGYLGNVCMIGREGCWASAPGRNETKNHTAESRRKNVFSTLPSRDRNSCFYKFLSLFSLSYFLV
jgi:hypothetical protein